MINRALRFTATIASLIGAIAPAAAQSDIARQAPTQRDIQARYCSAAAGRDMINVRINCPITIQHAEEIIRERRIDPTLLRLITAGELDPALQRIEALTRRRTSNTAIYLAIAATISSVRGKMDEAVDLSRRAYEAGGDDGLLVVRYHAALTAIGDAAGARRVATDAHRRRQQFAGTGRLWVDYLWLQSEHPPEVLDVWFRALAECRRSPPASCGLDEVARQNIAALRDHATALVREAAAAQRDPAIMLQMQYYGWHYILLCDLLLADQAAAERADTAIQQLLAQLRTRFGPWPVVVAVSMSYGLDQITPPAHLERKYVLFDEAMRAASTVPPDALARFASDNQLLLQHGGLILASYRGYWVRSALRVRRYQEAWERALGALDATRPYQNSLYAMNVRVQAISLMAEIADSAGQGFDKAVLRAHFLDLRRSFTQDPTLWRALPGVLTYVQQQLCEIHAMAGEDCAPVTAPSIR